MKTYEGKAKFVGIGGGVLLLGSELSAQTISWGTIPVPMSMTSIAILAALFVIVGTWILSKSKKHVQQFVIATLLVGGLYNYSINAVVPATVTIATASGTAELIPGNNLVCNSYSEDVTITQIDPQVCSIVTQVCDVGTVLAPSSCCSIELDCGGET